MVGLFDEEKCEEPKLLNYSAGKYQHFKFSLVFYFHFSQGIFICLCSKTPFGYR